MKNILNINTRNWIKR